MDDLISRRAAIDALGEEPEVWAENDDYALGLNNQWRYDINALKVVSPAPLAPTWIPVTERLPEDGIDVLVTDDSGGYATIGIDCMFTRLSGKREWLASQRVTAWMPLPEPYKEVAT